MNREEFVNAIKWVVQDGAITGMISTLVKPPGRKPHERTVALSTWFKRLTPSDKEFVERIMEETASFAVHNFLCVLDGATAIESGPDKGTLDLRYCRGNLDVSLNDEEGPPLHELL